MELSVILKDARLFDGRNTDGFSWRKKLCFLVYSLLGDVFLFRDGEEVRICEGEMYLSSSGEEIFVQKCGTVIALGFEVYGEAADLFGRVIKPTERQRRHLGEILRELNVGEGETCRYGSEGIIQNSLSTVLLLLMRGEELRINEELALLSEQVRSHSQAVRHYLLENYTTKITLDSLCYIFRTNKTALCKQFREEFGRTVFGYLHELRIAEAKRLLRMGLISVTDVSERLGFESIHYFSRLFKKTVGVSPAEYAKSEKKKQKLAEEI